MRIQDKVKLRGVIKEGEDDNSRKGEIWGRVNRMRGASVLGVKRIQKGEDTLGRGLGKVTVEGEEEEEEANEMVEREYGREDKQEIAGW